MPRVFSQWVEQVTALCAAVLICQNRQGRSRVYATLSALPSGRRGLAGHTPALLFMVCCVCLFVCLLWGIYLTRQVLWCFVYLLSLMAMIILLFSSLVSLWDN